MSNSNKTSEDFSDAYATAMAQLADAGVKALKSNATLSQLRQDDVEIAATPSDIVFRTDKVTLSRYRPIADKSLGMPPILIVYGLFGRQTMIDLQEDRSLVRNMLEAGLDVYVLDWGSPTRADQFTTLEDLIDGNMRDCVEYMIDQNDGQPITLFGICEGGTFSTILAALSPDLFSGLALAITPIDFIGKPDEFWKGEGFLNRWIQNMTDGEIDDVINVNGNMPGTFTGAMFSALTPMNSMTKYNLGLQRLDGDEDATLNFLRMEKWIADRPDHPGAAAKEWFGKFYRENQLIKGEYEIADQKIDLKNITCPVLNIYALQDHIVPVSCSKPLGDHLPAANYEEIGFPGGHVGVFVSRKAQGVVAGGLVDWIKRTQPTQNANSKKAATKDG